MVSVFERAQEENAAGHEDRMYNTNKEGKEQNSLLGTKVTIRWHVT